MASLKWLLCNPVKDNARVTFSLELAPAGVLRGDLALQTLTWQLVGTATLCWLIGMPCESVLMWREMFGWMQEDGENATEITWQVLPARPPDWI